VVESKRGDHTRGAGTASRSPSAALSWKGFGGVGIRSTANFIAGCAPIFRPEGASLQIGKEAGRPAQGFEINVSVEAQRPIALHLISTIGQLSSNLEALLSRIGRASFSDEPLADGCGQRDHGC
jgi:hypothetical protein